MNLATFFSNPLFLWLFFTTMAAKPTTTAANVATMIPSTTATETATEAPKIATMQQQSMSPVEEDVCAFGDTQATTDTAGVTDLRTVIATLPARDPTTTVDKNSGRGGR